MLIDELSQQEVCQKWGSSYIAAARNSKIGLASNVQSGQYPINGLRHPLEGDTSGWYIWTGEEFSDKDDFFLPFHVHHLDEQCPVVKKYLGLAPGWRFLLAQNYEDVWFDRSLLTHV